MFCSIALVTERCEASRKSTWGVEQEFLCHQTCPAAKWGHALQVHSQHGTEGFGAGRGTGARGSARVWARGRSSGRARAAAGAAGPSPGWEAINSLV